MSNVQTGPKAFPGFISPVCTEIAVWDNHYFFSNNMCTWYLHYIFLFNARSLTKKKDINKVRKRGRSFPGNQNAFMENRVH